MTEKKKDVNSNDTWGDLGQTASQKPATPPKRERQSTAAFAVERPSTKMIAVGGQAQTPAKPIPRQTARTLLGVPYTPPQHPPARLPESRPPITRTFKRPMPEADSPSQPLVDLSDLFPSAPAPAPIVAPKPVVPTLWHRFLTLLRRWRILR